MIKSRLHLRKITYSINISRLIEDVYYSEPREVAREFVSLKKFSNTVLNNSEQIAEEIVQKLYIGYHYLLAESRENFINTTFSDESCISEYTSLCYIADELLNNLVAHFCCKLAFYLLDTTDIDEFLDYSIKLTTVTKYNVTFTYED